MNCVDAEERFEFPPSLRLRKPAEYKNVFANPLRLSDRFFTILAMRNDLDHARLGLAIAKKNIKKAVARNKIKRLARESFRLHSSRLGSLDIVVLARKEAAQASSEILLHSLERHWLKLIDRCASYS